MSKLGVVLEVQQHELAVRRWMPSRVWPFMRVEAMRRTTWIAVGPLSLLAVLAGCSSDIPVSPMKAPTVTAAVPVSLAPRERPTFDLAGVPTPDSSAVEFTVGPSGGVFFIGGNVVVIPARSICDPATSGYGPEVWDAPCATIQTPIRIHAEVRRIDGRSWIDFSPALRFAPSKEAGRWVWVIMSTPQAIGATGDLSRFNILYAPVIGATPTDETVLDPTLRTYVDTFSGVSMRRIKHFSAYVGGFITTSGRCDTDCDGGSTPP